MLRETHARLDAWNDNVSMSGEVPVDGRLRIALEEAYALALNGRREESLALLGQLVESLPESEVESLHLARARILLCLESTEARAEAVRLLENLVATDRSWQAGLALARLARREGRLREAERLLVKAMDDQCSHIWRHGAGPDPLSRLISKEVEVLKAGPSNPGTKDAPSSRARRGGGLFPACSRPPTLQEAEEEAICRAMEATGGNKSAAARLLEIDRKTLYTKLQRMVKP